MTRPQKGFTLMELLIVIGVLGILAAGLLAAIDPFEQLKKARDTNNRSATIELMSAFTRYYANHSAFPWNMTTVPTNCLRAAGTDPLIALDALGTSVMEVHDMEDCINDSLILDGELKDSFFQGIGSLNMYVASDVADPTNIVVCFAPEGKSARTDPSTSYLLTVGATTTVVDQTGLATPACPNVGSANCLQCFK
jgi:prepilin-type N-terminal cleavage/methylation domain-containing protein